MPTRWLGDFERALASGDAAALAGLFLPDSHWRDVLALTWRIATTSGRDAIVAGLKGKQARAFQLDPARTAPREAKRAGESCVEAIFRFETNAGTGAGVLRLKGGKAWTLLTALEDIRSPQQPPQDKADPTVLVVGGGQAGLATAARLGALGIDALVVDRWPRVGDNWRRRYRALKLHNQVHVNHLPYRPFPPGFPLYIPKDQLADWFESYAQALRINYWTGAEFLGGSHDGKQWSVEVKRDGKTHTLRPRHVVMATGVSDIPVIPDIPALRGFQGRVIHSHAYEEGGRWKGKRAVVIGTGTSGHDIAQDLHSAGAQVTLVQRNPTLIINCDPSAQLVYALYSEGPPLEDCDLITLSIPFQVAKKSHQLATAHARSLDKPLLDALEKKGFRLAWGDEGTGWQFLYLNRGGGYYFNVGCSDLVAEGKIALAQFPELEALLPETDLVVLATGYRGLEAMVEKYFGAPVAQRVGPIWGFGEHQELRNMFQRTPQPGLWFIAGSFAQCRIYSKVLALQIGASEAGLI